MANVRLSALDRDFYSLLLRQTDDKLRSLALTACQVAVQKVSLKYPVVDDALRTLTNRKPLDPSQVDDLGKLVMALDATRKEINDRITLGKTSPLGGKIATGQARAANAVYLTANEDPFYAALEAIYEAYIATEDWPALKSALLEKFQK
ncbi:MAG TPA: hypothetical protein VII90_01170 [Anaerolineales bacterium]